MGTTFEKRNPVMRLFADSKLSWPGWGMLIVFSLLSGLFQTTAARMLGELTDLGIAEQYGRMLGVGGGMLGVLFLDCLRTMGHYGLTAKTTETMFLRFRERVFDVLCRGEMSSLEKNKSAGDLASRISSDIESLCELVAGNFTWFLRVLMEAAVAVVSCLLISWQLSLIYLFILPLSTYLLTRISRPIQDHQKNISSSLGDAAAIAADAVRNMETIKAFSLEGTMATRFNRSVDLSTEASWEIEKQTAKLTGLRFLVIMLQTLLLFLAGIIFVSYQIASVGSVIAFISVSASIRGAVELYPNMLSTYRSAVGLSKRIYDILDISVEGGGEELVPMLSKHPVEMRALSFGYTPEKQVISDITLRLSRGEHVGLVGPSGCGKSTIIKLICKNYAPTVGELLLFGYPVAQWNSVALRRHLSIVSQSPTLFDGTICENVRNGREDATESEVIDALKSAQLWEYVKSLPAGIHTAIGEYGDKLSGGQRQRVAIARAVLKNAELILLDEPTSALDSKTEADLLSAFSLLLENKTALIVSHRYAMLNNADYILCLNRKGRLVESGSPEELIALRGYFYRIKTQQSVEQGDLQ